MWHVFVHICSVQDHLAFAPEFSCSLLFVFVCLALGGGGGWGQACAAGCVCSAAAEHNESNSPSDPQMNRKTTRPHFKSLFSPHNPETRHVKTLISLRHTRTKLKRFPWENF